MRRVLLLIESNTTGTGRQFARCAADLGITPVLLTADPGRYAYVAQDGLEHVLIDTSDERTVLDRVRALAEDWQIAGVTSSSEYYIATAAACARALGLPGPAPEAVRACRDKREQREILRAAGVAGPAFAAARTVAQVRAAGIRYPVVVKPCQGSGSVGVRLCADREQAEAHAARLLQAPGNERGLPVPAEILVEQYLTGSEHSVEVFCGRSVATVDKHLGPPPWFVETGHDTPSRLPADRARLLIEAAEAAVAALGLDWGAVHVELRLGPDGARIVEVNPRLAGGMIPDLLRRAYGVDLIQAQVRAAVGLPAELPGRAAGSASIRFLMAERPGVVQDAVQAKAAALAVDGVAAAELYRDAGAAVEPAEDFRGRFGHIISAAERTDGAAPAAADLGLVRLRTAVRDAAADDDGGVRTGRLSTALNPQAHAIVYGADPAADAAEELRLISEVDRAHLVMLTERGVIEAAHAARLLAQIERLRGTAFAQLRDRPMPRGVYLAYEGLLSELLGEEVGGVLHTGRSRNDLGATTVRLRAREHCLQLLDAVDALAETLLDRAVKYQDVVMPAYTHGQPAVPITFGHYLVGVAASVVRGYTDLVAAGSEIEVNPLGAGAVGGTSVPIDPARTAELLGFTGVAVNSVDAVASREFVLRLLAGVSTLGVTVTRVARDLSVWTSEESGLLHLADDLVGSSSMMPQKRNPFLLEYIQGKASASLGHYVGAVSAMASAGYTNAIAVGTEAVRQLWPGLREGVDAATLLRLVVDGATPDEQRMDQRAADGFTAATYLAERLVASGVPFRTAHHEVGRRVLAALDAGARLDADGAHGTDLAPAAVAAACAYGGGPGGGTVVHAVDLLRERMSSQRGLLAARRGRWAEAAAMLDEAARSIAGAAELP
ncbi:argininosuccinate lyase [Catenulispora sp. NL8]|uniref:Argininosuccinate lyase n=1 Tax=Catenulispora pinistramenti TaxID=2705254 RepID=A0ABS5L799_9ACTN|nr:argininosuccinate lyase [Catenulispora pinistramenti]MBS2554246.1 argininosuccinate lyase [Catenulispora pinistramenti]